MKKGDIYEGVIESVEFPNKGILTVDGERLVVKNTIPGQKVRVAVAKHRKGKGEGRILEVLEKSPDERTEGVCPHFTRCGGCVYQSLPYEEQIKLKERQVKKLLDSVCLAGSYEWQGIKPSPAVLGYRNKMEFSFGDSYKGGPLALGMHRRGSFYDIETTSECQIVHPDFCQILTATRTYFDSHGTPFYRKLQHVGYLRHLLVRRAVKTGEILVALVTTTQLDWISDSEEEEQKLLVGWRDVVCKLSLEGRLAGVLHTQNNSLADVVQNDRTAILFGQDFFYEELLGLRFKITPFSFFQTNSLGAEILYGVVRNYIGETRDKVVFDLYSGTGTIAQLLAPVARKVVGVEIVPEAVAAAKENAAMNGLDNCQFLNGDVLKVVDGLADKPDLVVLDPPRDGLHPKALPKIAVNIRAKRMVYVSCKLSSLVRDLAELQQYGYRVERVCCVDLFPGTGHVETIVSLVRKSNWKSKPDTYVKLSLDMEDYYRIKGQEK